MNDLERQLQSIPLAEPNDSHERRMNRLFLESARRPSWLSKPVPLWSAVAACVITLAGGFLLSGSMRGTAEPSMGEVTQSVYNIPATPEFQRLLDIVPPHTPRDLPKGTFVVKVSPSVPDAAGDEKEAI